MRVKLFTFQETALADLHDKIQKAHSLWSERILGHLVTAPTGAVNDYNDSTV